MDDNRPITAVVCAAKCSSEATSCVLPSVFHCSLATCVCTGSVISLYHTASIFGSKTPARLTDWD